MGTETSGAIETLAIDTGRRMSRYYFDFRYGDEIVPDDEGIDFLDLGMVHAEAACSLAEMAKERICSEPGNAHQMVVEVRDQDKVILKVKFVFERTDTSTLQ